MVTDWNLSRLYEILAETTGQYRSGPVYRGAPHLVEQMQRGIPEGEMLKGGGVLEVYAMPPADEIPPTSEAVDVHFIKIAVDKTKAEARRAEVVGLLDAYPDPATLASGPSYIAVGAELGDQGAAFQLFALGKVLGLWEIISPEALGFSGDMADQMAGAGMVMITGFRGVAVAHEDRGCSHG